MRMKSRCVILITAAFVLQNAVHWLSGHPSVRPGGVGIVAISGGANIAFMMSYTCPQVGEDVLQLSSGRF